MRRNELFVGAALIVMGILLLFGLVLRLNVWTLIWPLLLVGVGLWIIWAATGRAGQVPAEPGTVPLEGAARARVVVHHGAGRLSIGAGAPADQLLTGTFGGGLQASTRREGDLLDADLRVRQGWPWQWGPRGLDWDMHLSAGIPLALVLETGAAEAHLDLTDLQVTELSLSTGVSSTEVTLPAHAGFTRVKAGTGVASVRFIVPQGVAVEFEFEGGLATANVDTNRFPRVGDVYRSPDYDTAANKVQIKAEAGVGSVDLR
jgi:hypothetical protein